MKYIRTKEGIYEVVEVDELEVGNHTQVALSTNFEGRYFSIAENGIGDCFTLILNETVIAEADTIEELCDEFVLKTTSKESGQSYYGLYYYSDINHLKVKEGFEGAWYGAIWTDTGLRYVAKMNEKGELELL